MTSGRISRGEIQTTYNIKMMPINEAIDGERRRRHCYVQRFFDSDMQETGNPSVTVTAYLQKLGGSVDWFL